MRTRIARLALAALGAAVLFAGCGGGSHASGTPAVPLSTATSAPTGSTLSAVPPGTVPVTFVLRVPQRTGPPPVPVTPPPTSAPTAAPSPAARRSQSSTRAPQFIPYEAAHAVATVTSGGAEVSNATVACTQNTSPCMLTLGVPAGVASTLTVDLEDNAQTPRVVAIATYSFPASGLGSVTVGVQNNVNVTFQPVVGYIAVQLNPPGEPDNSYCSSNSTPTQASYQNGVVANGTPVTVNAYVNVVDADYYPICGNTSGFVDPNGNEITGITLTTTSPNSPNDIVFNANSQQVLTLSVAASDPASAAIPMGYNATYNASYSGGGIVVTPTITGPNSPSISGLYGSAPLPSLNGNTLGVIGVTYNNYNNVYGLGPAGGPYVIPQYSGELTSYLTVEYPAPPGGAASTIVNAPYTIYDLNPSAALTASATAGNGCGPPVVDTSIQSQNPPMGGGAYPIPFDGSHFVNGSNPQPGGNGTCTVSFTDSNSGQTATLVVSVDAPILTVQGAKRK